MIDLFSVENYRSFARKQDIELRPLTLLFGWNSGGKSSLLRFLPLIAESIKANGPPVWLSGDVGRQATWPSLVSKATGRGGLSFALGLGSDDEAVAEWKINGDLEGRWQEIESLKFKGAELAHGGGSKGLLPNMECHSNCAELVELRESLNKLSEQVQWISGVRVRAPRVVTYGGGSSAVLSPDGADVVEHLISAQLRSGADQILESTQAFFAAMGEQIVLDNPVNGVWKLLLHPSSGPQVRVDLCDTGEGYSQVLPVLVALARAKAGGPRVLCLEQPELHLHIKAQVELAKQLVDVAKSDVDPRILVETHSEILLTSVQLAIANGDIDPGLVKVYWVESRADGTSDALPIEFNDKGQPNNSHLLGAFGEALRLGQQLMTKQLRMSKG
ncbi:AAA family ATPase [Pseudomonas sp. S37]|uniref:AAA family ATPase n=1 Tax=Pseudomonas sp. S37 TaxID=2767449 RepID=UPI001914B9F4|nr:AAA family ATPase [Pseudomonas sp. S37]MBK4995836.1 AAA family ATPase [Pseudomonas sp. S37]